MRLPLVELQSELKDATVFIVGGGSSLRGFDYSRLDGHKVIGINQACVYLPKLTAIYWADEDWAARNYDTLMDHTCKLRFCGKHHPPDVALHTEQKLFGNATALKITGILGFDDNINRVRGNNSGSHVINLCVNAGAKRIVLLGFDMVPKHWHDDYVLSYTDEVYEGFMLSINSMAAALIGKVDVINCSMNSAITAFPKISIDEILNDS